VTDVMTLQSESNGLMVSVVRPNRECAIVYLRGEVDLVNLEFLAGRLAEIQEHQPKRLVIDLADLLFLDAGSARTLRRVYDWGHGAACEIMFRAPNSVVSRVLDVFGLSEPTADSQAPASAFRRA
jgi:anti-anti-sigma factor